MDAWPRLRPLVVVSGTIAYKAMDLKEVTKRDRNSATVLVAKYKDALRKIGLFKTPFGWIVLEERLKEVRKMLRDATHDIGVYNQGRTSARLDNYLLWERLEGNRRAAVEGWINAHPETSRLDEALKPVENGASLAADAPAAIELPHR